MLQRLISLSALLLLVILSSPVLANSNARRNPLAGVYHPWRLQVIKPILTVSGTVERVKTEPDHDWHINIFLNKSYAHYINAENKRWEHGDLVVEVIPMDQPHIPRPYVGEHITVTGAYVDDRDHGWREIHPAWIINGHGTAAYTTSSAANSVRTGIEGNAKVFGKKGSTQNTTFNAPAHYLFRLISAHTHLNVGDPSGDIWVIANPGDRLLYIEHDGGPVIRNTQTVPNNEWGGEIGYVFSPIKAGEWYVNITDLTQHKSIHIIFHVATNDTLPPISIN